MNRPIQARHARTAAASPDASRGVDTLSSSKHEALVEAAVDLFSSQPYEDVSVDDLARRAGVAHGLVSYYFGSKRGLFADAVAFVWAEFVESERPRVDEVTPSQIVRGYVSRLFAYAQAYPQRFELMRATHADASVNEILEFARAEAMAEVSVALGCPSEMPAVLATGIRGWHACLEALVAEWLRDPEQDLAVLTELSVRVLVTVVQVTYGHQQSSEEEQKALALVAGLPRDARAA